MTHKKQIDYIEWRGRISDITPSDMCIGDDVILIDNTNINQMKKAPFKTDVTTCVIYLQGEVWFRVNMRDFHAKAPCMVTLPADAIIETLRTSDDVRTHVIIMSRNFSNSLFSTQHNLFALEKSIVESPVLELGKDAHILAHFYTMLRNLTKSNIPHRLEAARHLTLALFYSYTSTKHDTLNTQQLKRCDEILNAFVELVHNNYKQQHEVGFYASKLCITPKYLSKIIKEASGKSAVRWIEEFVTTEAKALLNSTTLSIQQISDLLGFESQSLFGKYFKRVVGLSPRAWRATIS
ncbi:MAG: AraC family transcriptional regulator [Tidjanibacter sp.]|nr:AraC family transcriptional regulator [Tidjanibacter sp.]